QDHFRTGDRRRAWHVDLSTLLQLAGEANQLVHSRTDSGSAGRRNGGSAASGIRAFRRGRAETGFARVETKNARCHSGWRRADRNRANRKRFRKNSQVSEAGWVRSQKLTQQESSRNTSRPVRAAIDFPITGHLGVRLSRPRNASCIDRQWTQEQRPISEGAFFGFDSRGISVWHLRVTIRKKKAMHKLTVLLGLVWFVATLSVLAADKPRETRCYELRTYYAAPDKLKALNARFRNHTLRIFEKHGLANIGYWTPTDNPDNKLVYVLAFPSREAAKQSWKEFDADPEWQKAAKESEANGRLVTKVESVFLNATDYSPEIKPSKAGETRLFEIRTSTATPSKLENLNSRFRDHTCKLF